MTNGPLLQFEVNGRIAGDEIHLPESGGQVTAVAQLDMTVPVEKLEFFGNGKPLKTIAVSKDARSLRVEQVLPVKESGWLTLRARGGRAHPVSRKV